MPSYYPYPWTPVPDYAITGCWMIAPPVLNYTEWVDEAGDIPGYYKAPCTSHRMTLRRTVEDAIPISIDGMERYGTNSAARRLMVFPIVEDEDLPAMINVTDNPNEYLLGYITRKPDEFYFFDAVDKNSLPGENGFKPNPDIIIKPFLGIKTYFVRYKDQDDDRNYGVVNVKDNYYCLGLYNDNDMLDENDPDDAELIDWDFFPLTY